MTRCDAGGIETAPIISNFQLDAFRAGIQRDGYAARLGVPGCVAERLLRDAVERDLNI